MSREEILEAAAQIFSQKGFHAASMQDIAQAVNLQKASLYHHIPSKQQILLDLLDRALDVLTESMLAVVEQPLSPEEKLRLAMRAYLGIMLERRDLASVLLLEHRSLDPELHDLHIPRRDRFESLWRDLIQEGIEQGYFNSTDPGLTARGVLGVLNWTTTWYRTEGKLSPAEIADYFSDLFLQGLLTSKGEHAES